MINLTREEARALLDANDVESLFQNEEELEGLKQSNPTLFKAYQKLREMDWR